MQEQGYATISETKAPAAREATFNDRLNRVGEQLIQQCDRIEAVLSRVNGTPRPETMGRGEAPTPIRPTSSLSQMVENLEMLAKRLSELRAGVERIA